MTSRKQTNLSSRTKRRRVKEELQFNNISDDVMVINYDVPSSLMLPDDSELQSNSRVEVDLPTNPHENNLNLNFNQYQQQNVIKPTEETIYDSDDNEIKYLSSETDEDDDIYLWNKNNEISSLMSLITQWAITFNIPQNALSKLLLILRQHSCFETIPKDARTIMHSATDKSNIRVVEPGKYHHFGILNGIKKNISEGSKNNSNIQIAVGIDGLPLYKSNSEQFWPILAYIHPYDINVFPIGIYCGKEKPKDSNDFIKDFIDESKLLIEHGVLIDNKKYIFSIRTMCCDTPAKSYILKIKGHSGFYSCSKCEIEGEYLANRICFPYMPPTRCRPIRTHQNYLLQSQEEHHIGNTSLLATLPMFDVVKTFSLDYMHLVCLGTVRKLLLLWIKGPIEIRYPSWKIEEMSKALEGFKTHIPCEFARKPRTLLEVSRWKATEFRLFLLYIGIIVTKPILKNEQWKHFFGLSIAMIILLSPDYAKYINLSRILLDNFVKNFEKIYGRHLISHNIHGLTHISEDYERFGPLDSCSAFPFENYMCSLKKMLRKPNKPLEQVVNRYKEICELKSTTKIKQLQYRLAGAHKHGPVLEYIRTGDQFTTIILETMSIKTHIEADSYLFTCDHNVIKVFNIIQNNNTGEIILICKQFENKHPLFMKPIESTCLNIYIINKLSNNYVSYTINNIKKKMIVLPFNNNFIALPIIHSTKNCL